jgi:hypothetical protein
MRFKQIVSNGGRDGGRHQLMGLINATDDANGGTRVFLLQ